MFVLSPQSLLTHLLRLSYSRLLSEVKQKVLDPLLHSFVTSHAHLSPPLCCLTAVSLANKSLLWSVCLSSHPNLRVSHSFPSYRSSGHNFRRVYKLRPTVSERDRKIEPTSIHVLSLLNSHLSRLSVFHFRSSTTTLAPPT